MTATMEKLVEDLQVDNEWMLVNPQGLMWRGKPNTLLQVLAQQCSIETLLGDLNENMGLLRIQDR